MTTQLRRVLLGVLTCGLVLGVAPSPADARPAPKTTAKVHSRGDVVLFVQGATDDVRKAVDDAKGAGAKQRHALTALGGVSIGMPAGKAAAVQKRLAKHGVQVSKLASRHFSDVPNDTFWDNQSPYLTEIDAPQAWDITHGSSSVLVAVVDSGVKVDHPDLVGKVAGTYNAVTGTADVTDVVGHGTMVAGMAVAATNNGEGIAGTGYASRLLAVKVADSQGRMSTDDVAAGVMWAADHGAKVINLSLGGPDSDAVESSAMAYAQNHGAVVVAAAGNESTTSFSYPAAHPGVVAVGATDTGTGLRADFSNYGSWVDLAAPGTSIGGTTNEGGYAGGAGTSFSAPLVSGAVALMAARAPGATVAQLANALTATAKPLAGQDLGAGLLDMDAAVASLVPSTVPAFTAPTSGSTVGAVAPVSASSTAGLVQLTVDGAAVGAPVAPSTGTADWSLETWGLAQGAHTLGVADCNQVGCNTAATEPVTVDNPAPTLTSPASGATVQGTVPLTADVAGGGVRFLVDGVVKAFDGTAPYQASVDLSALAEGGHTLTVVGCNAAGTACSGPATATPVTVHQLHPSIVTSVASFSPNGDGRVDLENVVVRLADTETVDWKVLGPGGVLVRGPVRLGTDLAAGDHTLSWNGRSNSNVVQPNGWYTVVVDTSAGSLVGSTSRSFRLDTVSPYMASVVGYNGSVYPVHDGFRDTITLGVTVNEAATVDVRIKSTSGAVVRLLTMKRSSPGPLRVVWSGYGSNGRMVPAGTYYAYYSSRDAALNYRSIGGYKLTVSQKKAVQKTAVVYPTEYVGVAYAEDAIGNTINCAHYVPNAYGMTLYNNCDESSGEFGFSGAFFHFTVPSSPMYTSLRFDVFGHSTSVIRPLLGMTYNAALDDYDAVREVLTSTTDGWRTVSTPPPANHILNRVVEPGVLLPQHASGLANFEVGDARLVVGYKVLV